MPEIKVLIEAEDQIKSKSKIEKPIINVTPIRSKSITGF